MNKTEIESCLKLFVPEDFIKENLQSLIATAENTSKELVCDVMQTAIIQYEIFLSKKSKDMTGAEIRDYHTGRSPIALQMKKIWVARPSTLETLATLLGVEITEITKLSVKFRDKYFKMPAYERRKSFDWDRSFAHSVLKSYKIILSQTDAIEPQNSVTLTEEQVAVNREMIQHIVKFLRKRFSIYKFSSIPRDWYPNTVAANEIMSKGFTREAVYLDWVISAFINFARENGISQAMANKEYIKFFLEYAERYKALHSKSTA